MKIASWNDCLNSNSSIRITPDKEKALSLIEVAHDRIRYANKNIDSKTVNYIFEDYYSSVLELFHALILLNGYKVNNHICLGFFIKDILKREDLFHVFDDCRYKRNSLVYYGKKMDFDVAKDSINRCNILIKELDSILKDRFK